VTAALSLALESALGSPVRELRAIPGGDINDAYCATLTTGLPVFVKTRHHPPPGMYACEADGLAWLAEAACVHVPRVLAVRDDLLVLEWIESGPRKTRFDEQLGRGLAKLHRAGAPSFGHTRDNFIANLPQANAPLAGWSEFYRARRLEPLVERASSAGVLEAHDRAAFARLYARLDELVGPSEPPARLHGDLWSGNVHGDQAGVPVLIDPAVYGGHREVDLAMLQLFGHPSGRFFAAYDEAYPRADGHGERVALYQLYPLLVHVCLFGRGYLAQLRGALEAYA
jgi:fructosamine-3-kinase